MTATAAFSGLRPVANALGCGSSIRNTRGIGKPARPASSATSPTSSGALLRSTSWAPYMRQHHAVGVPVGEEIGRRGNDERDHGAAGTADQIADAHEQGGEACEQHCGTKIVHGRLPRPAVAAGGVAGRRA